VKKKKKKRENCDFAAPRDNLGSDKARGAGRGAHWKRRVSTWKVESREGFSMISDKARHLFQREAGMNPKVEPDSVCERKSCRNSRDFIR